MLQDCNLPKPIPPSSQENVQKSRRMPLIEAKTFCRKVNFQKVRRQTRQRELFSGLNFTKPSKTTWTAQAAYRYIA
jgi:hypothetical protein